MNTTRLVLPLFLAAACAPPERSSPSSPAQAASRPAAAAQVTPVVPPHADALPPVSSPAEFRDEVQKFLEKLPQIRDALAAKEGGG